MTLGACPRCGGPQRRMLAPGFYECTSQVVADVVPPGVQGNVAPIAVPGQCGHRYQEGAASMSVTTCRCGMFAVGVCATCGEPRCGEHARHGTGGFFVCVEHIAAVRQQEREDHAARERAKLDEARAAVAEERAWIDSELPGFPSGPTTGGSQLAAALARLVPSRRQEFETDRKSFGRRSVVSGWSFHIGSGEVRRMGREEIYLVLTESGDAWRCGQVEGRPSSITAGMDRPLSTIDAATLRKVLRQVLDWTGKRPPQSPTDEQRYLVEFDGQIARPGFSVWARDNR